MLEVKRLVEPMTSRPDVHASTTIPTNELPPVPSTSTLTVIPREPFVHPDTTYDQQYQPYQQGCTLR
ncbi:hypothetical protein D3C81_144830 [compost metagenome]